MGGLQRRLGLAVRHGGLRLAQHEQAHDGEGEVWGGRGIAARSSAMPLATASRAFASAHACRRASAR